MQREFLDAGNPRKISRIYAAILQPDAINCINREIENHVSGLYNLALNHFRFAERQKQTDWRQRVSRYYYATYNCSKALRYFVDGHFSEDSGDHKKVGELPNDFPDVARYRSRINSMRTDRNTCDYDHIAEVGVLLETPDDIALLTKEFLIATREYCLLRHLGLEEI